MGGRGHFDWSTMSIPVENRKYKTLDVVNGIKIIEDRYRRLDRTI
jgi:hypothetical protein